MIEEIKKEAKRDLVRGPCYIQWRRSFHNLHVMNKLISKAFTIAGVTDQKESYFESQRNIAKEVVKIWALKR